MRYLLIGGLILGTLFGVAQPKPMLRADSSAKKAPVVLPYTKIIPEGAYKKEGLFTVSNTDSKWFFEIPDSLFKRVFSISILPATISKVLLGFNCRLVPAH